MRVITSSTKWRNQEFGATDGLSQRFTGKERDTESGLNYFGARYYGAALGRFTSPDPENAGADEADPQSWNAYAYARNSPLVFTDPDGRDYKVCQGNTGGLEFNCVIVQSRPDRNGQQVEPFDQFAKENGLTIKAGDLYDSEGNQIGTAHWSDGAEERSNLAGAQFLYYQTRPVVNGIAVATGGIVAGLGGGVA